MTTLQTINGIDFALAVALLWALYSRGTWKRSARAALKHLSPRVVAKLKRSESSLDCILHEIQADSAAQTPVRAAEAIIRQRGDTWDPLDG